MSNINKIKDRFNYSAKKYRHGFLNDSILIQSIHILKFALLTVLIFVAILFYVNDKSPFSDFSFSFVALKILFYIDTFDNLTVEGFDLGSIAINHNINLVHTFILVLLVVVWQAVLIFKMMQTDESIIVSEGITYYPKKAEGKEVQSSSVVFRLMNEGFNTVYNVNVTAFLRIKPSNGPYRHYKLTVRDPFIASLEVGMPYAIFINTGEIKNVEYKADFIDLGKCDEYELKEEYKDSSKGIKRIENYIKNDEKNSYKLIEEYTESDNGFLVKKIPHPLERTRGKPIPDEAWIVVLIESFDDFLDQTNITKKVYDYHNIQNKEFTDIESKLETVRREESRKKIKKDIAEDFDEGRLKKKENSANWHYDGEEIDLKDNEAVMKIKDEIKDLANADKPYNIFDKDEIDKYFNSFGEVNRDTPSL